jgi:hypothetical protein
VIPRDHTLIHLEDELPGAQTWAERHGDPLLWVPEALEVRVALTQPETKELFFLRGHFDDYREIAPAWTFTDAVWTAPPRQQLFPRPAPPLSGGVSVFHPQPVICAPFNRLAYRQQNGPHNDWGGPANWLTAGRPNEVKAHYLGDMLSVMHQHFVVTRGRMA